MQDKLDKLFKDKLDSFQPEFNPKNWTEMERMLDGKGTRGGFLYWKPLLLVFAFLSVSALVTYLLVGTEVLNPEVQSISSNAALKEVQNATTAANNGKEAIEKEQQNSIAPNPFKESRELNSNTQKIADFKEKSQREEKKGISSNENGHPASGKLQSADKSAHNIGEVSFENKKTKLPTAKATQKLKANSIRGDNTFDGNRENAQINSTEPGLLASIPAKRQAEVMEASEELFNQNNRSIDADPASILNSGFSLSNNVVNKRTIPKLIAYLPSSKIVSVSTASELSEDLTMVANDDEILIPKNKSLAFSMSGIWGATESYIDNTRFSELGYSSGVTAEMMYKNTVGISTGLIYTTINYGTTNVICEDNGLYVCPLAYKSRFKSLEIPIDIRLNILRIKRWNFYVSTGISNFIKLDETFGYDVPLQDTIPAQQPPSRNVPFNQSAAASLTADGAYAETATDFSLSDVKRHHLNYHVAAGIEYRINKKLGLALQPNYGFTLREVGIQNKRLYSYGVNAKFNFFF